jgi:hypothetical protein
VRKLIMHRLAAARCVRQTRQPGAGKTAAPLLTVAARTPTRAATAALLSPSATPMITAARNAKRCSLIPAASHARSVARSSLVSTTSAGRIRVRDHINEFMQVETSAKTDGTLLAYSAALACCREPMVSLLAKAAVIGCPVICSM